MSSPNPWGAIMAGAAAVFLVLAVVERLRARRARRLLRKVRE